MQKSTPIEIYNLYNAYTYETINKIQRNYGLTEAVNMICDVKQKKKYNKSECNVLRILTSYFTNKTVYFAERLNELITQVR